MRTRFICWVGNAAVMKALFKIKDDQLTFQKVMQVAVETEDAAKVAKETIHGSKAASTTAPVFKMSQRKRAASGHHQHRKSADVSIPKGSCMRCGEINHSSKDCRFIDSTCRFCHIKSYLEAVCIQKKGRKPDNTPAGRKKLPTQVIRYVKYIPGQDPAVQQVQLNNKRFKFEVDSGAKDNFCSTQVWSRLGRPTLQPAKTCYMSATGNPIPVLGTFNVKAALDRSTSRIADVTCNVTKSHQLNLLGRTSIASLNIDVCKQGPGSTPAVRIWACWPLLRTPRTWHFKGPASSCVQNIQNSLNQSVPVCLKLFQLVLNIPARFSFFQVALARSSWF